MSDALPADAPPSAMLRHEADQLAHLATVGLGLPSGKVATLARRLRDIAKDVDNTERMKAASMAAEMART
jgi:hypothetical protein